MTPARDVTSYIASAPKDARPKLRQIRTTIRAAAPDAVESIGYGMPFYSFKGKSGVEARLCYFGFRKKTIVFYTRPKYLEELRDELIPYSTSKSALHFRLDRPIPIQLIRKLVKGAARTNPVLRPA